MKIWQQGSGEQCIATIPYLHQLFDAAVTRGLEKKCFAFLQIILLFLA